MKNRRIKQIISAFLCCVILFGAAFSFTSCKEKEDKDKNKTTSDPSATEIISVVRLIKDVPAGERIVKSAIETVYMQRQNVPETAATTDTEVLGKFMVDEGFSGDFLLKDKLADKRKTSGKDPSSEDYIVVTDFITLGADVSDDLQELIDNNPNRTLYFPDGNYYFSKPVKTSSAPGESVSFRLSNYAIFQSNKWTGKETDAIIQFGAKNKGKGDTDSKAGNDYYFLGGIICCNRESSALSVEGTGNVIIHNLSIKESIYGIHIKSDNVDVDNVVIIGTNTQESIGVLVDGSYNTLSNMRIFHINTGIKLNKGNNVLRTLHPLYAGGFTDSCGFWDTSEGNYYDICYSDHFAVGFRMDSHTRSVYNGCFAFWYAAGGHYKHWGFEATGQFNSLVRNTRIDLSYGAEVDATYLKVASGGGNGMVLYPICGGYNSNDDHKEWRSPYLKTDFVLS